MTIKKFLLISVVIHAVVIIGVYFLPASQAKKAQEFITQLVTPEEARKPEPSHMPALRPVPPEMRKGLKPPPFNPISKIPPPMDRITPKTAPSMDSPVVPGSGKDDGKPLPEGISPKPGTRQSSGEEGAENLLSKPGYLKGGKQEGKRGVSDREKIFDRGVIGDTAMKGEGSRKKDESITFDTKDYRYAGYMRKLKEKIESIWEYPAEAGRKGLYGDLKVSFTIKKDGTLGAVELVRTSGYKILDAAALKALRDGEPYWPIPDGWGMESYTIQGHFFYTMYGYGIR